MCCKLSLSCVCSCSVVNVPNTLLIRLFRCDIYMCVLQESIRALTGQPYSISPHKPLFMLYWKYDIEAITCTSLLHCSQTETLHNILWHWYSTNLTLGPFTDIHVHTQSGLCVIFVDRITFHNWRFSLLLPSLIDHSLIFTADVYHTVVRLLCGMGSGNKMATHTCIQYSICIFHTQHVNSTLI